MKSFHWIAGTIGPSLFCSMIVRAKPGDRRSSEGVGNPSPMLMTRPELRRISGGGTGSSVSTQQTDKTYEQRDAQIALCITKVANRLVRLKS